MNKLSIADSSSFNEKAIFFSFLLVAILLRLFSLIGSQNYQSVATIICCVLIFWTKTILIFIIRLFVLILNI